MAGKASDLAARLAQEAEAVCRHYLSNGRREGRYWLVGDARNTPGRSLHVRLGGTGLSHAAAGRWTDAGTGEYGDLLDIIRLSCGLTGFPDVVAEARRFLGPPRPGPQPHPSTGVASPFRSLVSARRLFAMSQPIAGTLAEIYLHNRGIATLSGIPSLRFHPRCYYRPDPVSATQTWPALIAAVTDLSGTITGVHRTWLDPSGTNKAPVATPRRAMGHLLGNAVRFGTVVDVLAAGEGIETMLSLKCAVPAMPMLAALSAAHLAAILFPTTLRRLYIASDNDPAGETAARRLAARAQLVGIEPIPVLPKLGDFNEDLCRWGSDALRAALRAQVLPEDGVRFLDPVARPGTEG
jgi:Toprim domain